MAITSMSYLERIRDIRSSEKVFWQKVLDIYATSIDYDPKVESSIVLFKTIQDKMHWAAHGHTAAEIKKLPLEHKAERFAGAALNTVSTCFGR